MLPGDEAPLSDSEEICNRLDAHVDLVIDAGACGKGMTTVINLVGGAATLIRAGMGPLDPFGFSAE
jgi:tRNA A37 threonylcarbamoyladenosine synthetase subunit TsaC/SUA5/YrdC